MKHLLPLIADGSHVTPEDGGNEGYSVCETFAGKRAQREEHARYIATACNTHHVLVKLVKDAAAVLEQHLIAGSTSTADETLNKLLGILDDSKTVKLLREAGAAL